MSNKIYTKIIELVVKASQLARTVGIDNLLQPGLVKEMIIADILGHELITSKRNADARDPHDSTILYEYLSCKEGGSGQFDRMFKEPPEKRQESLNRIWRNNKIYLAVFYSSDQTKVKVIFELEIAVAILPETIWLEKSITVMNNIESHLYHFGIGLGIAIIAPCLAWEHLMYLREKRKREQKQRAREQAEAIVAELQKEVDHLRNELAALQARSHPPPEKN